MAVQYQLNNTVIPFYRDGDGRIKDSETFEQDAARAAALAQYTVVAQKAATRKWVPLTSVDPTLTKGKMVCGAAGTAEAGFQAVSDGEFAVTVDGVAMDITGLDFTGIEAPTRTGAVALCGALGTDEAGFQAVSDGEFAITVDGVAMDITGLDFSGVQAPTATGATAVCGALGTNLAGFQAVTNGGFGITVDGVALDITGLDFSSIAALDEIVDTINSAALGTVTAVYDSKTTVVSFLSETRGDTSTITVLGAPSGGTDISGAGFLNGASATLVQGTGDDGTDRNIADVINDAAAGRFSCTYNGSRIAFLSHKRGDTSTITVLSAVSGGAGTDISGAGFLNGLAASLTQGTGDDGTDRNLADVINDAAAGRFFVTYDGARVAFYSPTLGTQSSVTVLSAVSGGAGTDISGAGYLNGLTGTGTATAGTGGDGSDLPSGIFVGSAIAAADLVAGDVTGQMVLVGGNVVVDKNQLTLENSLAVTDVVVARGETIEAVLQGRGIYLNDSRDISSHQA